MIEKLDLHLISAMQFYDLNVIQNKINELVDRGNALEKALIDNGILAYAKPKTDSAESTEKLYTLDEVAEMLYHYDKRYGECGIWDMPKHTAGFCKQNSCGGQCKDPIECWKHAIQSGWLKGE